jgi:hypothetical protein
LLPSLLLLPVLVSWETENIFHTQRTTKATQAQGRNTCLQQTAGLLLHDGLLRDGEEYWNKWEAVVPGVGDGNAILGCESKSDERD